MKIKKDDLMKAASRAHISPEQVENLWNELETGEDKSELTGQLSLSHVMYFIGSFIVISALSWFIGLSWEILGGKGLFFIAVAYIVFFIFTGNALWKRYLQIPGGLLITIAVCVVPLAIYGFQNWTGWWLEEQPGRYSDYFIWVKSEWFTLEVGTIIAACIALYYYSFPFLTAPLYFSLWFMSMDITPLLFPKSNDWDSHAWVSLWFGLAVLIFAFLVDKRTKKDFAYWGYFFGMLAFWSGLSLLDTDNEFKRFIYLLINLFLIVISILLQRTVFLVFGVVGVFIYISSIAYRYFSDSIMFPFVLSFIGIATIFFPLMYRKYQSNIEGFIVDHTPNWLKELLPSNRK